MPIWTLGCFWDSILGQVESAGWSSETGTLPVSFSLWVLPWLWTWAWFLFILEPFSLNLSHWTSPQSNSCIIWKEFFRPQNKNYPFEVVEVGAMREKVYPLPGSVTLKQQSTQLAVCICACLISGDTCVLLCPLGLSSSCWLLGFADFSMWYYFFFGL